MIGRAALAAALLAACTSDTYVVVTVDARPAVHDAATLRVALTNGGTTLSDDLSLAGKAFPVTFSLSSPTATGSVSLVVDALDGSGVTVGHGTLSTALDAKTAVLLLDSADFVVNTEYAMNQIATPFPNGPGVQIAATSDDEWTVVFRDDCASPCNMYARRFDARGVPVSTALAAGTNQFNISTTLTSSDSTPAVAANGSNTLVIWDSHDNSITPSIEGISCRPLDASGNAPQFETLVSTETALTDVSSATPLANGNFALVWDTLATPDLLRSIIVGPDCTPLGSAATLEGSGTVSPTRSHVASTGNSVLYTWIDSSVGDLHVRGATSGNVPTTADITLASHSTGDLFEYVRAAALGSAGFALAVRRTAGTAGRILLYRVSTSGIAMGDPSLVTDKAGMDDASISIASRADGAILVAWHACGANGDGMGCGVLARVFRPTGAPVGDPFVVPTTIVGDQTDPSVAALGSAFVVSWADLSEQAPDVDGSAIRARVIYPPYDDAQAISGASCGSGLPGCGSGLVCAPGTDGARCYAACPSNACPGGGTCTAGACVF